MNSRDEEKIVKRALELDSAAISEALDSLHLIGVLDGIKKRSGSKPLFGRCFTVKYEKIDIKIDQFQGAGNYIDRVPSESVVLIDSNGSRDFTNWGNLLTHVAIRNQLAGTVVFGSVRDIDEICLLDYPLFSTDIAIASGKNRSRVVATEVPLKIGNVDVQNGDWIFADANGVVVIPDAHLVSIIEGAEYVILTEKKIKAAIQKGSDLYDARTQFRYDQPWLAGK